MADSERLNEKYMEFQMLDQKIKQVNQQLVNLDSQLVELSRIGENLDDIKDTKMDTEILVALGGGVFSKAVLKDNKKVLMNVGANVMVEKDVKSSKVVVGGQIDQIKDVIQQLEQEFQLMAANSQMLQMELQKLSSEMKELKQ